MSEPVTLKILRSRMGFTKAHGKALEITIERPDGQKAKMHFNPKKDVGRLRALAMAAGVLKSGETGFESDKLEGCTFLARLDGSRIEFVIPDQQPEPPVAA